MVNSVMVIHVRYQGMVSKLTTSVIVVGLCVRFQSVGSKGS